MRGVPAMYPASMVATRVMLLLRRNPHTTTADVARAAGVPVRTITRMLSQLADDPDRRVRAATAHAVMTATIAIDPAGGALVDGTVTRRKVEALACAGWPVTAVAAAAGLSRSTLTVGNLRTSVRASTRDAVDVVWVARRFTPGPEPRTTARAAREGWVPTGAWANIDDPHDRPDLTVLPPRWAAAVLDRHPEWAPVRRAG